MTPDERIRDIITKVQLWALPFEGARLHLGEDALDELKRKWAPATTSPSQMGQIGVLAYGGIPVVVEDGKPNLIELRWTIHG